MCGKLILLGTPIGNLGDISKRAIEQLQSCDFIAAEDTRVTSKLLNHLNIKKPLISYYEHNKFKRQDSICNRILNGEICVLVSDAGMPAISDPGEDLVNKCIECGIEVTTVPGPSAVTAAIAICGIKCGRFTFEGFLSVNKKRRTEHLLELVNEKRTMVFYEAPHKLCSTINDMLNTWGNRNIAIVRELTKIHEEVIRTDLLNASKNLLENNKKIKGEIVLIIEPPKISKDCCFSLQQAVNLANSYIKDGYSILEASKLASKETKIKKSQIYNYLVQKKYDE